ncbi:MAG: nickel transporter [Xanthomonadales bacterium]|nr:nickel transporter [Xanthomonadales bacterium]
MVPHAAPTVILISCGRMSHIVRMKKKNIFRAGGLILVMGLLNPTVAVAADETPTVRIALDLPYAPMEFERPDGSLAGFDIALGDALCRIAELDCRWVVQAWEGIVAGLMARKYDVILSAMAITPERLRRFRIVGPYLQLASAWFVPIASDLDRIEPETLAGHTLGVQRGTVHDRYVTRTYGEIADIKRYRSVMDIQLDLDAHRLDAAFVTRVVGQHMFNSSTARYRTLAPAQPIDQGMGIALRKDEPRLAETFAAALAEFRSRPAYDALIARWIGAEPAGR